jgi:hypothetical protein
MQVCEAKISLRLDKKYTHKYVGENKTRKQNGQASQLFSLMHHQCIASNFNKAAGLEVRFYGG